MTGRGEPQIEPDSYHGVEPVRDPREDMREPVPDPDPEQAFYAHGVGSVMNKLHDAEGKTTAHQFDEAISIVEDALDDLKKLSAGPDDENER